MSVNKCILIGNIGQNPEIRATQDGREIANFSLATSESWKDKATGERKDKTEWHRIVVFSQGLVGIIKEGKNWIKKGTKLYLEGKLQTRKWTDSNGIEKYSTEIVLNEHGSKFVVVDYKPQEGKEAYKDESLEDVAKKEFEGAGVVEDGDQDIPF